MVSLCVQQCEFVLTRALARAVWCPCPVAGVVHPWVGQIRLKRNVKTLFETDESGDVVPLSEATADLS